MQGLITLDLGNSNPHAGIFKKSNSNWNLSEVTSIQNLDLVLENNRLTPHNSQIVVTEVRPYHDLLNKLAQEGYLITQTKDFWKGHKFFGMPVSYANTIGQDRLIQSFYTYKRKLPPTLLIDAGTFTTIDIVTEKGLLGGYILPNFSDYFSLFQKGEGLKSFKEEIIFKEDLPQTTSEAMSFGYFANVELIKKIIKNLDLKQIIITGGRSEFWSKLDLNLPAELNPNYIHESMHFWMTTQIELL